MYLPPLPFYHFVLAVIAKLIINILVYTHLYLSLTHTHAYAYTRTHTHTCTHAHTHTHTHTVLTLAWGLAPPPLSSPQPSRGSASTTGQLPVCSGQPQRHQLKTMKEFPIFWARERGWGGGNPSTNKTAKAWQC